MKKKRLVISMILAIILFGLNVFGESENSGCYENGYPVKGFYLNGQERTKAVSYDENIHDVDPMVVGSWIAIRSILEVIVFFEDGSVFLVTRSGADMTVLYNGTYLTEDGIIHITYEDVYGGELVYQYSVYEEESNLVLELINEYYTTKYESLASYVFE